MSKPDLLAHLPDFWADIYEVAEILDTDAEELLLLDQYVESLVNNLYVMTAERSLPRWERAFGITPGLNDTVVQRRERIQSRLRLQGTVTKESIANVAAAFSGGDVTVIEAPAQASITVKFTGTYGVPNDVESLGVTLREMLPAHLAFAFAYTYLTWAQIDAKALTWAQIDAKGLTWTGVDNGGL
ncbi:hypothetical protein BLD48_05705 [Exiguobacterium sp. KRL4]|uniref:putative phage tail protein n=1 Tax=Exiguobacterium sp. KRL4 TaxID=1914536 RepID=UPI0008F8E0BD|nr:putative phage tail protein [Exiguobacterium sp. KRL4]OIN67385.1 hypothetical protein BLD48_05705 [Exiguobacterium sp. KRL4]